MSKSGAIDLRLLAIFSGAVATVAAILLAVLYFAALQADRGARDHEQGYLRSAILGQSRRLDAIIAPRATWDEAVAHLDNRFDHGWADANFGPLVQKAIGVDITSVVDDDGALLYATRAGKALSRQDAETYMRAAQPVIAALRQAESQRGPFVRASAEGDIIAYPIQANTTQIIDGTPYLLSATLVQPSFGRVLPKGERTPIVIAARALDAEFLKNLSSRLILRDLELSNGQPDLPSDAASMPLVDINRDVVATLHWRPDRPGLGVFYKAAPPVCIVLLALAICLYVLLARNQAVTRRLSRSETRLQLALQAANAGAFEIDLGQQTFWCSPEMEEILQRRLTYPEAATNPWPVTHPDDRRRVSQSIAALETQDSYVDEVRIVLPSGDVRWIRVAIGKGGTPEGGLPRITGLVLNIDERKKQELALIAAERAANAAVEAKSRFLATVSHEIRTPMNGILGVLHLLKTQSLSQDGALLLGEALACGQMLTSLIDDVLDFSKIEAGQLDLTPIPLDPVAAMTGVGQLLRPQCDAKGIFLKTAAEESIGWVRVDPIRLRQVLFNLIGNAVKFTADGGVSVRLSRPAPDIIRYEVEDTGVGIAAAVQGHVFDQFHQGDSSTTRRFGGAGLGLSITRSLARMMGGDVGFDSCEGRGSVFWLEVSAPSVAVAPEPLAEDAPLHPLRVLVVEDNPTNRLVATRLLESMGLWVQTADDGEAGVEAVKAGGFDLVLMDVQMPRMDGLEATRCIRALGDSRAHVPIIALTANAMIHQRRSYLEAGMNGLVAKPISPAALSAEINRVMTLEPDADIVAA